MSESEYRLADKLVLLCSLPHFAGIGRPPDLWSDGNGGSNLPGHGCTGQTD
jgi:hypothetical protein